LPYPRGIRVAGIPFEEGQADVRLYITSRKSSIRNLNFQIRLDGGTNTTIFGVGNVGDYPGVRIFPPRVAPIGMSFTDHPTGSTQMLFFSTGIEGPINNLKLFGPIWRVLCTELTQDTTLELVINANEDLFKKQSQKWHNPQWTPDLVEASGHFDSQIEDGSLHTQAFHIQMHLKPQRSN
jgi:hypothetical protein